MQLHKIQVPRSVFSRNVDFTLSANIAFVPDEIHYLVLGFPTGSMGVVLVQMPNQQCRSVTNCFEDAASEIYAKMFIKNGKRLLEPFSVLWLEYWPIESREEGATLDVVELDVKLTAEDGSVVFDNPHWQSLPSDTEFYKKLINTLKDIEYES